jgi:hypothetical protein
VLETSLSLETNRQMYILCCDTKVDATKFLFNYENTKSELIDHSVFLFQCRNLKFEAFKTNRLKESESGKYCIWNESSNAGCYYLGSDDDDLDDLDNLDLNNYKAYEQDELDDDPDDFDDFINDEEQEMYKEI